MTDERFILHHYDGSPFAEKIRLVLGAKGLAWRSVKIPPILPKPDLVALTGGYRRTPVLQHGADVWCDTALIARVLDAAAPEPPLFPPAAPLAPFVAAWADATLFWTVIPYAMQPAGVAAIFQGLPPEALRAFAADRAPFTAGMTRQTPADATANLGVQLAQLAATLADGRRWLCGDALSIADFSVAHSLWYLRRAGPLAAVLDAHPALVAWHERVRAFGHGRPERLDAAAAIDEAASFAAAGRHRPAAVMPDAGFEAGQRVTVTPTDYGRDPVAGALVGLTADEVVVARDDPRAGRVHVHFPRAGYQILKETPA